MLLSPRSPTHWLVPALAALVLAAPPCGSAQAQTTTTVRTGSGFAVSHATHIVTNAHVVMQCKSLRVLAGTQQSSARVLAADPDVDLAVLQTSLSVPKTVAVRSQPALRLGESVIAFGFPLTGALSQGGNLTTGNVSALAGLHDDPKYIQVTAPVQPGNSGGPLLDGGGNLVGVITAKLDALAVAKRTGDVPQNVNFAVRADVLEAFLQAHKVSYDVAVTDAQLAVADVADMAKQASVRIECRPSGVPAAQPDTVRVSPQQDPAAPPDMPGRAAPVPSDATQEQMVQQIELTDVRTPYPGTAPAIRELDVVNRSPYSVLQITVGWLEGYSAAQCPTSRSAYRGAKDLYVSLQSGQSGTTMGEFSEQAKYFCVLAAQFLPPGRRSESPQPPAPETVAPPQPPPAQAR
ncbi:MAG TPA: serine protease [Burkholderiales bacterium]|nr:serine protease [Burkholderiales bacterium]